MKAILLYFTLRRVKSLTSAFISMASMSKRLLTSVPSFTVAVPAPWVPCGMMSTRPRNVASPWYILSGRPLASVATAMESA